MKSGIRWQVYDRDGNEIYLTEERWQHIIASINHPDMVGFEDEFKETLRRGSRRQDAVNPQKYRYSRAFGNLTDENTHIVVQVLFRFRDDERGRPVANNYVVTAYQKEV